MKIRYLALALLLTACESKSDQSSAPAADLPPATSASAASIPTSTASAAAATPTSRPSAAPKMIPPPPDVAAPPADAQKTASGIAWKVLEKGKGKEHPKLTDRIKVNYTGWTKEGRMFDSSSIDGEPVVIKLEDPIVIKGWKEGLQLMVAGEKRRFWIPAALAYGDPPKIAGAPRGDLVFDIELVDVLKSTPPPPTPPDVKAPPKDATKTASGLEYKVLKKGSGKQPGPTSEVTVNYTGWTTDGKMFDSSFTGGEPITFPLDHVIKGWTEGVQLMHVGDTVRFWIPSALAYGDHPKDGRPAGMLVFDIELLDVK